MHIMTNYITAKKSIISTGYFNYDITLTKAVTLLNHPRLSVMVIITVHSKVLYYAPGLYVLPMVITVS